ncbi:hypothetical protein ACFPL7_24050 [Dongia soli]|uniref:Glycosyltransferase RgtA/B/C/D-like domain-containing protein n=1 Tax=Dongia soli TaxID=600628 RepID=A0ABU5EGB5_9PROT|nr:hypothetical protein [Dongia soli]MDY0885377.1 hypothetical protein [Dongia soli]
MITENGTAATAAQPGRVPAILSALVVVASGVFILRLVLAYLGILPPINAGNPDLSAPGLIPAILVHIGIGCLLFGGVLGTGLSAVSLIPARLRLTRFDLLMVAPIAGLCLWIILCLMVRLLDGGSLTILAIALGVIAIRGRHIPAMLTGQRYYRANWTGEPVAPASASINPRTMLITAIMAIAFASNYGLLWRLPSAIPNGTLGLGDMAFFTGAYHSMKLGLNPFLALTIEGESFHPFNQTPQLLALGFDAIPGFEISLYMSTAVSLFFFLTMAFLIATLCHYRRSIGQPALNAGTLVVLVLLLCASTRYPSWIVETPPYAFGAPLALSIIYLIERGRQRTGFLIASLPLSVIAFGVTKVMVLPVIGCYAACNLCYKSWKDKSKWALLGLAIGGGLALTLAVILVAVFWRKFTSFATPEDIGPYSLHKLYYHLAKGTKFIKTMRKALPSLSMDIALVWVLFAVWRLRNIALFLSVLLGASLCFIYAYVFGPTAPTSFLLVFAWLLISARESTFNQTGAMRHLGIAAALALYSFLGRDVGRWEVTFVWAIPIATMAFTILKNVLDTSESPQPSKPKLHAWQYAVSMAAVLSIFAHATGELRLGWDDRRPVSPRLYDLWVKVRELTPANALIFTDQTGESVDRLVGWNDFSMTAERQFYISSWSTSALRGDKVARASRLEANAAVIKGDRQPQDLRLKRSYDVYFAAVRADRSVPVTFKPIYNNGEYAIYQIP